MENIECEIKDSLLENVADHYWLLRWATAITLDLETDNTAGGSGDVTISVPLTPELFGLTLSGGPTKEYKSGGTFSYSTYLADIAERPCGTESTEKKKSVLTGHTGAGEWLTRVADDASFAGICPDSIDFGIEFTVTFSASGNPTISGITIGDGTLDVDLLGDADHGTDHELTLSVVPVSSSRSSSGSTATRVLSDAVNIVQKATGTKVSSKAFQACTPLAGTVAAVSRRQVDEDTKDSLDRAVGASLLRSIDPSGP